LTKPSFFQNGSVSDDDLIELLDLALSSDTTNTVRKAREMMSSSVDPLQLVSQLANLIMDILSGKCQSGLSDISKNFFGRYACMFFLFMQIPPFSLLLS
jgi:DNA polymerase III gamma/tau subunit